MFFEEVKRTEGSHDEKNRPLSPPVRLDMLSGASVPRVCNENARGDARALEMVVGVRLAFQDRVDHPVVFKVHGEALVLPTGDRRISHCSLLRDRRAEFRFNLGLGRASHWTRSVLARVDGRALTCLCIGARHQADGHSENR